MNVWKYKLTRVPPSDHLYFNKNPSDQLLLSKHETVFIESNSRSAVIQQAAPPPPLDPADRKLDDASLRGEHFSFSHPPPPRCTVTVPQLPKQNRKLKTFICLCVSLSANLHTIMSYQFNPSQQIFSSATGRTLKQASKHEIKGVISEVLFFSECIQLCSYLRPSVKHGSLALSESHTLQKT